MSELEREVERDVVKPESSHGNSSFRSTAVLPRLSIISPTYNERGNVRVLTAAISATMGGIPWELIFVDDDSPDGTAEAVLALAKEGYPVRCIRRVGRRGLASAVVEGALTATAENLAVIDADMQHDETLLPRMLAELEADKADLVVGSRHVDGGGLGEWSRIRTEMSAFATRCATAVIGSEVSDPMSGFFAIKRDVFHACIYDLSQQGYKILLDILTSSPRPLKIVELPYVFRNRTEGESKMDVMVLVEFAFLLIEKITRGILPPKFLLFLAVGGIGLVFHLLILTALGQNGFGFFRAQEIATLCAITLNYVINNEVTYRSQRLRNWRFVIGYVIFCAVCTIGSLANIGIASLVLSGSNSWPLAGIAGAMMSAVFNFGAATQLVWSQRRPKRRPKSPEGTVLETI